MRLYFNIIFILIFTIIGVAQNITIKGKAHPSHIGKQITLCDYTDYVTYTQTKESIDTIDKNGYFELKLQSTITKPILLQIDNLNATLYVQPKFTYGVYFPEKNAETNNNQLGTQSTVNVSVYGKDSTELNALIIDFNTQYNNLFSKVNTSYISPSKINQYLDTFTYKSNLRYNALKNNYFKQYVTYTIAGFYSNTSRSKTILFKQFIDKKPILYNNYEYMAFFNAHYKGYLQAFATKQTSNTIFNSINKFGDYADLKAIFKSDKNIANDTLRELVLLKGLIEVYYNAEFNPQQVKSVIEQLQRETLIDEHKNIALNFLQTLNKLQPGANAPNFLAKNKTNNSVNLHDFKGKFIYLNFFSTQSDISLKEMTKLIDLKKKFSDRITFISVCLDDSFNTYAAYLKANLKMDWIIVHNDNSSNAKQNYAINSLSGYFFINQQLQLMQSPAPAPSMGIEYKFNALFKPKGKNRIIGVR